MANPFRRLIPALLAAALAVMASGGARGGESILLASTTSTDNSGLFGHILPMFEAATGIAVKVVAQGTGQALETGRRGDADVLLVHDRAKEDGFVADGYGVERRDVMYNDFVLVGPGADPSGVRGSADVADAFQRIAAAETPFVSRGDDSGTNGAEKRFWVAAGIDPNAWSGYRESGSGMGATLNMAAGIGAYTLSDRGTWLAFGNRRDLEILYSGDPRMFNPYGIMLVNPERHSSVQAEAGMKLIDWITGPEGQAAIAGFKVGGEQLFFPSAK